MTLTCTWDDWIKKQSRCVQLLDGAMVVFIASPEILKEDNYIEGLIVCSSVSDILCEFVRLSYDILICLEKSTTFINYFVFFS